MKKVSIRNIIIGIGIGMMLTSTFNMFNNYIYSTNLENKSVEEIKELDRDIETDVSKNDNVEIANDNEVENGYYEIDIRRGMTTEQIASHLQEEKVITDAMEFINTVKSLNMTNKLDYGKRRIPYNSTIEEILTILSIPN